MTTITEIAGRLQAIQKTLDDLAGGIAISGAQVVTTAQLKDLENAVQSLATVPTGGKFIGHFTALPAAGWTQLSAATGKFLRGAATYGGTGGADTHTHTFDQVIAHTHTTTGLTTSSVADHSHLSGTLSAAAGGGHSHSYLGNPAVLRADGAVDTGGTNASGYTTGTDGSHSHSVSGSTGADGGHSHTVSGTIDSTGVAQGTTASGSTLPSYLEVLVATKD